MQLHLHKSSGDSKQLTITTGPSIWLEVDNRVGFDGFYVQVMQGTVHGEKHIHYEWQGYYPSCIPVGFSANNLTDYLPGLATSHTLNIANPHIIYQQRMANHALATNPTGGPIGGGSHDMSEEPIGGPGNYLLEPPCVCKDPSTHSEHCQYIQWKRKGRRA